MHPDKARSLQLYETAIAEGEHCGAMMNLAALHHYGDDGIPANWCLAVDLYLRVIRESYQREAVVNVMILVDEWLKARRREASEEHGGGAQ